jgi:hypothetical protein
MTRGRRSWGFLLVRESGGPDSEVPVIESEEPNRAPLFSEMNLNTASQ